MQEYVCLCVYVCMRVCVCVRACLHACMYVCVYVCASLHVCVHVRLSVCVRTRVCMSCMCACMDMHFEVVDTTRMYIATLIASLVTKYVSLLTKFWL